MKKLSIKEITQEKKYILTEKVSRGHSQRYLIEDLLRYGVTDKLNTYMKAPTYGRNYIESYKNAVDRLQKEIKEDILFVTGPQGGEWSGYYKIKGWVECH